jgi:hypothetical protein
MSTVASAPSAHRAARTVPDYTPPPVHPGDMVRISPDPSFSGTAHSLGIVLEKNPDKRTLVIVELWGRGINRRAESYHVLDPYCKVRSHLFARTGYRVGCWKHFDSVEQRNRAILDLAVRFGELEKLVTGLTSRIVALERAAKKQ